MSCYFTCLLQEQVIKTGETHLEETLLEGHLGITRELLAFQSADKKYHIGSEKGGANLIKVLKQSQTQTLSQNSEKKNKNHGQICLSTVI